MRSELLLIEKIEQYLDGSLSKAEHAAFEKEIASSSELQNEVALQREIMGGVQRSVTKKEVALAFVKYKKLALLFKLGMIGASALVGTAVTVAVVHYTNNNSTSSDNNQGIPAPFTQVDSIVSSSFNPDSVLTDSANYVVNQEQLNNSLSENLTHNSSFVAEQNSQINTSVSNTAIGINNTPVANMPDNNTAVANTTTPSVDTINKTTTSTAGNKPVKPVVKNSRTKKDTRLADLFWTEGTNVTWLGMDFTNVKLLVKPEEFIPPATRDSSKVVSRIFKEWNDIIFKEKPKYNLNDALYNPYVRYYMDHVNKRNDTIQCQRLFVRNKESLNHLNPTVIQKIVNTYDLQNKEGLGIVFIVESLDKLKENKSSIWVTIIDMKTKDVLLAEKMTANPGGNGVKNYWARSFYNTIIDIESKKFNEWKKKHRN